MIKSFVVRHDITGEILRTGFCPEGDISLQARNVNEIVEENVSGVKDSTHYFDGSNYVLREEMPVIIDKFQLTADGIDKVTITNVPVGTQVRYNGTDTQVDDGIIEFFTDEIGLHRISLRRSPQYKPMTFTLTAVSP